MEQNYEAMTVGQLLEKTFSLFFKNLGSYLKQFILFFFLPGFLILGILGTVGVFLLYGIGIRQIGDLQTWVGYDFFPFVLFAVFAALIFALSHFLYATSLIPLTYEAFFGKPLQELKPSAFVAKKWAKALGHMTLYMLIYSALIALSFGPAFLNTLINSTTFGGLSFLLILGGVVYIPFIFLPTFYVYLQAALHEDLSFVQGMKRSAELTRGMRGQIIGVTLLMGLILYFLQLGIQLVSTLAFVPSLSMGFQDPGGYGGTILAILFGVLMLFFVFFIQFSLPLILQNLLYFSARMKKEDMLLEVNVKDFQEELGNDPLEY